MHILIVVQGSYGERIVKNITSHCPEGWKIKTWSPPSCLPPIIEEPEEFLPSNLPRTELVLCIGESPGVFELLPALAKLTRAQAAIAPYDNIEWLPAGLKNQIKKELEAFNVSCVFPSPFCSLTERSSPSQYIKSFANYFGKPEISLSCNEDKIINQVTVHREAPCGCTRFIAEKLTGVSAPQGGEKAHFSTTIFPAWPRGK